MRPLLRFLDEELIERIISEAKDILRTLGMEIHNQQALELLADHGARIDPGSFHAWFTDEIIDRALASAPSGFRLYDAGGRETHDLSGEHVHFTPGSAAINILDHETGSMRKPVTGDYIRYARLMCAMDNIASQSTAIVPTDVPDEVTDSYRLFLSLLFCPKPVVTGAFTIESFELMKDLQVVVRGSEAALKEKPLTIFSVCPTAPLKWSEVTSQNLLDCAEYAIPVEYVSMPLTGFMSPVTIVGTLVQHTAETLSGVVLTQLKNPGAPALWGGSPAAFDVRYETTPMGAAETLMIDCAASEIGKHLGLPTQAYSALSDAKLLDAQAGLETSMGATLSVLAGINNVSGPGMLDFESCQSLEKLVLDNEICGLALRLGRGIEPRDDFPALPLFEELLRDGHLLISDHTLAHLRDEHYFPSATIDRANRSRWQEEGSLTLGDRAHREVEQKLADWEPVGIGETEQAELTRLMEAAVRRYGLDELPVRE
ncbi:trimethylamine methyltransferase family protein [Gemmatimonadota bacterium]